MSPTTEGFPSGADIARRFLSISPYIGHLGIRLTMIQPDVAQLSLPFTDALVTTGTVVHGGAIASLIDSAAAVAAWSGAEVSADTRGTTVGLTVNYLAAAQNEDIQATAHVLRRGGSLVDLDGDVQSASGTLIPKALLRY